MIPASELDRFLPDFDIRSAHSTLVNTDLESTYAALCETDMSQSTVVKTLMWMRTLGKAGETAPPPQVSFVERLQRGGFVPLAVVPAQELVFGIAGRFWRLNAERLALGTPAEWKAFATLGYAKVAWNICLEEVAPGRTRLKTQTRILCYGPQALARFRAYWFLVGPFSGLIRLALLRQVKRAAEARAKRPAYLK